MLKIKSCFQILVCAGVIVFFIGLYFAVIGAGIPYQEPTIEMTIEYMANELAGTACIKSGAVVFGVGLAGLGIAGIIKMGKKDEIM